MQVAGSRAECKKLCLIRVIIALEESKEETCEQRTDPADGQYGAAGGEGNLNVTDRFAITPEDHAVLGEEIQIVREAVAGLPEKYRVPIYLYYSADLSVAEIAEVLMVPAGTVKSRMNKAKQLLKKELEALRYDR